MKFGAKIKGRFVALMLAAMMSIAVMPSTAFAQVKGDLNAETEATTDTTEAETEEEKIGDDKEEIYGKTDKDLETTNPMNLLTPDGNLSLVDDLGKTNGVGKQFITVVTKTGNYFYIIIDRDDEGEGTVHFLNQVDEADIFNLLSEEEQKEHISQIESIEQEKEPPAPEPEEEQEEPEVKEDDGGRMRGVLGIIGILALVGAGPGYYLVNQSKKKKTVTAPDSDADYSDDDEDEEEYLNLEEASEGDEDSGEEYYDSEDETE